MKLSDFDQVVTLAENSSKESICAVRYGKVWRFYINYGLTGDTLGLPFESKQAILNNSYDYILKQCGYYFKESDLLPVVPKLTTITLTQDQKVAINTALQLVGNSTSDHAEQCYMYLKQITQNF